MTFMHVLAHHEAMEAAVGFLSVLVVMVLVVGYHVLAHWRDRD